MGLEGQNITFINNPVYLIIMNTTLLQLRRKTFTRRAYHKMAEVGILSPESRVELIRGEIIEMSPSKSSHASTIDLLGEELIYKLKGKAIIRIQNPLDLGEMSEPEPDLVVAFFQSHRYTEFHPKASDVALCIEVADSSLAYDREIKASLYAESGIPEYWIINLLNKQVEVHKSLEKGVYTHREILFAGDKLSLESFEWELPLELIFG